jgi:hypothetical protein
MLYYIGMRQQTEVDHESITQPLKHHLVPPFISKYQKNCLKKYLKTIDVTDSTMSDIIYTLNDFIKRCEVTPENAQNYIEFLSTRKISDESRLKKKIRYVNNYLKYIKALPKVSLNSYGADELRLFVKDDIQRLYNELIIYSRMRKDIKCMKVALAMSLINYLCLSSDDLCKMKLDSLLVKDKETRCYYISIYDEVASNNSIDEVVKLLDDVKKQMKDRKKMNRCTKIAHSSSLEK